MSGDEEGSQGRATQEAGAYQPTDQLSATPQDNASLAPKRKRRKVFHPDEDPLGDLASLSETQRSNTSYDNANEIPEPNSPQEKQKSKYRIHVPKNGELPLDIFQTQPSRRSVSPYRIDKFYWQKPRRGSFVREDHFELTADHEATNSKCHTYAEHLRTIPISEGGPVQAFPGVGQQTLTSEGADSVDIYGDIMADLPSDAFSESSAKVDDHAQNQSVDLSQYDRWSDGTLMQQHGD